MHDTKTVAFEINSPIKRRTKLLPQGYRKPIITIWHVDPERRGDEDSCGWAFPKVPGDAMKQFKFFAREEALAPWFQKETARTASSASNAECLLRGAIMLVAQTLGIKISFDEAASLGAELLHNPFDNMRSKLCFLPGYHSNFEEDRVSDREQSATEFFWIIARVLLQKKRPWYKHPRWHFWHWSFQIHPWQRLRRWLFSRCAECGKRFQWGYAPISMQWDKSKPGFMKSEADVYHHECRNKNSAIDESCTLDNKGKVEVARP